MTDVSCRPVVYVGSTVAVAELQALLPDAIFRPPVSRGDLYRDRLLRHRVFAIIDGVFQQDLSVSPREIVSVLKDGGLIFGAASMGALRAVECAPAGMIGVGLVYRLYCAGYLADDDEVAVRYNPATPPASSSVALVNIRYAVARAKRDGVLTGAETVRVIEAARVLEFGDRHWNAILQLARLESRSRELVPLLSTYDAKKDDARRLCRHLARLTKRPSFMPKPRDIAVPLLPSELDREREFEVHGILRTAEERQRFLDWLALSGRAHSLVNRSVAPDRNWEAFRKAHGLRSDAAVAAFCDSCFVDRALLLRACEEPLAPPKDVFCLSVVERERLWAALHAQGEVESEILRFVARQRALAQAKRSGLEPSDPELREAERVLAANHGVPWLRLLGRLKGRPAVHARLVAERDEWAIALMIRSRW